MSRAWTKEEVQERFLNHMKSIAEYWINETRASTPREKVEGLLFSMMGTFDGESGGFPAVDLSVCPHEDDKDYHESEGDNWYEPGMTFNDDVQLHEMLSNIRPRTAANASDKPAGQ